MKNKIISFLVAAVMILSTLAVTGVCSSAEDGQSFIDVPAGKWYSKAVSFCAENGYMTGTAQNVFSPDLTITRAMMVTLLWRMAGSPPPEGDYSQPFLDVMPEKWYTPAVRWAFENGFTVGSDINHFSPDMQVTREMLAQWLFLFSKRYLGEVNTEIRASLDRFTDVKTQEYWATNALSWALASKIMTGRSHTLLAPKETATRAETAQMIYKLMNLIEQPVYTSPETFLETYGISITASAFADRMPSTDLDDNKHRIYITLDAAAETALPGEVTVVGNVYTRSGTIGGVVFEQSESTDGKLHFSTGKGALNGIVFEDKEIIKLYLTIKMDEKYARVLTGAEARVVW